MQTAAYWLSCTSGKKKKSPHSSTIQSNIVEGLIFLLFVWVFQKEKKKEGEE